MLKQETDPSRLARRLIVLVLVLTGVSYFVFLFLGVSITAPAVVELEKALIQVTGFLIAFTGIIFTGMLADVRSRIDRAHQKPETVPLADKLSRTSNALRKNAFASFILFTTSLAASIGNLAAALAFPSNLTLLAVALIPPLALMVGGLALLLVALALVALD